MTTQQKAKHTPGPWTTDAQPNKYDQLSVWGLYGNMPTLVAQVEANAYGHGVANAHLIAAAPDLLAACLQAQFLMQSMYDDGYDVAGVLEAINAAIEKAVGGK